MTFPPMIRLPQGDEVLAERGAASISVYVSVRSNPPALVEWFHNGRPLSRFKPRFTITDSSLQISKVSDLDAGTYVIKATNGIGDSDGTQVSFNLIVYPLFPNVAIESEKTLFKPGEEVMIPCRVRAYPFPEVNWYRIVYSRGRKNRIAINGDDGHYKFDAYRAGIVTTLSQLIIHNATQEDSGAYQCEAISEYFEAQSDVEGISIHSGPSSTCIDSPAYTHCDKIVEHNYCGNKCE